MTAPWRWTFRASGRRLRLSSDIHPVTFDDGVGEEAFAHLLHAAFRLSGVLAVDVEFDGAADADVGDVLPTQTVKSAFNRLALNVQNAGLQEHVNGRSQWMPPWMTVGISFMIPRRRATSV